MSAAVAAIAPGGDTTSIAPDTRIVVCYSDEAQTKVTHYFKTVESM